MADSEGIPGAEDGRNARGGKEELDMLRRDIDAVDDALLDLLRKRATLSRRVGENKRAKGSSGPVYRPEREQAIIDRLIAGEDPRDPTGLPAAHIKRIWREIFSSSRELQQPTRVAFLGPEGTFSHMAAQECLGHSFQPCPQENFHAVFRAVHDGRCDVGIIPLENTLHGTVGQNFDLFAGHAVHIIGEHYSRISHCLMSRETRRESIRRVCSHPQPLGQCAGWLRVHLAGVPLSSEDSTAAAAKRAREEAGTAAIGHPDLADQWGLHILASAIEDSPGNWTRFVLIAPGGKPESGRDASGDGFKTSLLITLPHHPGSLARVLALLADGGINMSKLESRPMRDVPWQYVFFVDACGDLLRSEHAGVMAALKESCQSIRVLGVYPHAPVP